MIWEFISDTQRVDTDDPTAQVSACSSCANFVKCLKPTSKEFEKKQFKNKNENKKNKIKPNPNSNLKKKQQKNKTQSRPVLEKKTKKKTN